MWSKSSFIIPAVAAISFCLSGGSSPAAADIIHVPGDYLTIQEAIDAAMDGDEVEVHPGTYNENINLLGKAITVRSSDGAGVTTIDAGGKGTVVTCSRGEGPDTILDGFTITGGSAKLGGGMYNFFSSPTVTNCIFAENLAEGRGGGMYNRDSSPTVTDCMFVQNSADFGGGMYNRDDSPTVTDCMFSQNSADFGGGMYNAFGSNPTVTNCTFIENTASPGPGGGMSNALSSPTVTNCTFIGNFGSFDAGGMDNGVSSPTVTNCTFMGNSTDGSGGGMRNINNSNPTVTNCSFIGNSASNFGGGMWNQNNNSSPIVTNCTFSGNTAQAGGGMANRNGSNPTVTNCSFDLNTSDFFGGGMHNSMSSSPSVTNCTFTGNTAANAGGGMFNTDSSNPTMTNCILWDDSPTEIIDVGESVTTVSYSDVQDGWPGTGNIDADPLFVDPDNDDYHLSPGSPCIDAADNTAVPKGIDTDLEGNPRLIDDPKRPDTGLGDCPIVDIGSYEFQEGTTLCCPGDADATLLFEPDQPYLSEADSPLDLESAGYVLENFEDGLFNIPGVGVSGGEVRFPGPFTDSVDLDDGVPDGFGTDGHSFLRSDGQTGITFTFDAKVLGQLPTQAGLVWTDGNPQAVVTFDAVDAQDRTLITAQATLGDDVGNGTTAEDRFFGVDFPGGIAAISISTSLGGLEIDHVQFVVPCPWDLDGDGIIGVSDLLALLATWGPCKGCCPADFDGDDNVGVSDLLVLLANWGPCP